MRIQQSRRTAQSLGSYEQGCVGRHAFPLPHASLDSRPSTRAASPLPRMSVVTSCRVFIHPRQIGQGPFLSSHNLLPLRPWPFLVESVGIGVTSSILPILSPFLARALMADCAPGPGVLVSTPPRPRSLMWMALMPTSWSSLHTSTAASIARIQAI